MLNSTFNQEDCFCQILLETEPHVLGLKFKSSGLFYTYFKPAHTLFYRILTTSHVEFEVELKTRDARKQQVCLKPGFSSFKDLRYEVISMIGELGWRVRDCCPLKYKLLFLPCYFFSISIYCFLYNLRALLNYISLCF